MTYDEYKRKLEFVYQLFEREVEKVEYWQDILKDGETEDQREAARKNIQYYHQRAKLLNQEYVRLLHSNNLYAEDEDESVQS